MCNNQSFRPAWTKTDEKYDTFLCPKCGYPQFCGCPSCKDKIPNGLTPYKWKIEYNKDHDALESCLCANCGFEASIDYWFDECAKQYKDKLTT